MSFVVNSRKIVCTGGEIWDSTRRTNQKNLGIVATKLLSDSGFPLIIRQLGVLSMVNGFWASFYHHFMAFTQ